MCTDSTFTSITDNNLKNIAGGSVDSNEQITTYSSPTVRELHQRSQGKRTESSGIEPAVFMVMMMAMNSGGGGIIPAPRRGGRRAPPPDHQHLRRSYPRWWWQLPPPGRCWSAIMETGMRFGRASPRPRPARVGARRRSFGHSSKVCDNSFQRSRLWGGRRAEPPTGRSAQMIRMNASNSDDTPTARPRSDTQWSSRSRDEDAPSPALLRFRTHCGCHTSRLQRATRLN